MSDEKEYKDFSEAPASPRWIPLAVIALAILAIAGVGFGFSASSRATDLQKDREALSADVKALKQSVDVLSQRLKQTEEQGAGTESDMKVVADKLKLTQGELVRARGQSKQIREEYSKRLGDMQKNVDTQLASKASADDLKNLSGDVSGVKGDLDATKQNLQMARGELGTLIARNHEEVEQLRRMGQRDYFEFNLTKKGDRQKVGNIMVELRSANPKRSQFTVAMYVDDTRYEKKNRSANEPIYFYSSGSRSAQELVVNKVGKNSVTGYVSNPKTVLASAAAPGR